jgi:hypothetical protein
MRGYEPHCPSRTCTEGQRNKLFHIKGKPNCLHSKFRLVMPLILGISAINIIVILYQILLIIY